MIEKCSMHHAMVDKIFYQYSHFILKFPKIDTFSNKYIKNHL